MPRPGAWACTVPTPRTCIWARAWSVQEFTGSGSAGVELIDATDQCENWVFERGMVVQFCTIGVWFAHGSGGGSFVRGQFLCNVLQNPSQTAWQVDHGVNFSQSEVYGDFLLWTSGTGITWNGYATDLLFNPKFDTTSATATVAIAIGATGTGKDFALYAPSFDGTYTNEVTVAGGGTWEPETGQIWYFNGTRWVVLNPGAIEIRDLTRLRFPRSPFGDRDLVRVCPMRSWERTGRSRLPVTVAPMAMSNSRPRRGLEVEINGGRSRTRSPCDCGSRPKREVAVHLGLAEIDPMVDLPCGLGGVLRDVVMGTGPGRSPLSMREPDPDRPD